MPIEYDRGVEGGRVTVPFEIQEAITFRDAAASSLADIAPSLLARDAAATRELTANLDALGRDLDASASGRAVAPAERVSAKADRSLELIDGLFPQAWKDAASGADFDVIAASLSRLANAARAGSWSRAEQARLEAYGIFELGPEQRLRGIAPTLFQRIEGLFWYGDGDHAGLVQLVKRKDGGAALEDTLAALQAELEDAAQQVGSGAGSTGAIVTNSAIVVFREGLEAVLILAALMASMVGANRRFRRPLLIGVGIALVASAITWAIAQTVLGSLGRYGEKLEAVVSVVAIAVLLLILNWFYHRVYWQEHLAGFHQRKQRLIRGAGVGVIGAQALGLALLGFSSVYREGFETVLFLQAVTLEAGVLAVLPGVMLGLAATFAVGGADDPARAQAAAPEDADRDRDPDDLGARDPRRDDGADVPGRRLAARGADRGVAPAVLGRHVARRLSDVAGRDRPGRCSGLRRRLLSRRRAGAHAAAPARAGIDPRHHSLGRRQGAALGFSRDAPPRPNRPRARVPGRLRGGRFDDRAS